VTFKGPFQPQLFYDSVILRRMNQLPHSGGYPDRYSFGLSLQISLKAFPWQLRLLKETLCDPDVLCFSETKKIISCVEGGTQQIQKKKKHQLLSDRCLSRFLSATNTLDQ